MTVLDTLLLVVVDEPGRERDALRTMLASLQNIRIVEMLDDCKDLSHWTPNSYPDVVVIRERSLNTECRTSLMSIKMANPRSRFLVIVENNEQLQALMVAGMDHVFLRGFSSTELFALLDCWVMDKMVDSFSDGKINSFAQKHSSYQELMI